MVTKGRLIVRFFQGGPTTVGDGEEKKYYEGEIGKPDYDYWIKQDYWSLNEAVCLLHEIDPDSILRDESFPSRRRFLDDFPFTQNHKALERTIQLIERGPYFQEGRPTLKVVWNWIEQKKFSIPEGLKKAAIDFGLIEPPPQQESPEKKQEEEKSLLDSQRHRERCRAIAELLWNKNPDITIKDMSYRDDITTYGCEKKVYNEATLRDWMKDLCPNRGPGRRPKK